MAQPGGVLVRAGHTEAGCDLTQLAGLTPAAVICEILKDDGSMARLADLVDFARLHGLKIGAITDLIHYRSQTERLIERVGEQAGAVLHNAIVFEQTQEDSLTDPLTALPNRRSMFVHLSRELARAERLKSEVSLLVMDLDNFKDINDTYGHHVGDRALRDVASVLRTGIRPYDICVRYAGDEFIVVLSGCGGEEAERKRLELQRAVDSLQFEARPGKMLPLAISVGASVFPHDGDSYETLLATADSRMYRDKTRRKRESAGPHSRDQHAHSPRSAAVSDTDVQRAAVGIL